LIGSPGILLDRFRNCPRFHPAACLPQRSLLHFSLERIARCRVIASGDGQRGDQIVPGKKYLTEQAATLLRFAKATTDPDIAAGYLAKAADLSARSKAAPDASPKAPDVEQPKG
jgi:hypothetical protein